MKLIPNSRGGALWRFALAAVIVVAFAAATTAVAGLLQVKQFVDFLNATPALKNAQVSLPPAGAPETLLLIGSDHRAGTAYRYANTDTMMLVRIDDSSSTINVLSIPRDLKVTLPGVGTSKLNAAYSVGGPNLLIRTLKTQVFPGLVVNHIMDVNFRGFSDLIDALGCVYADVDHRYYNNTALTGYSSINIRPGYQKLCGNNQADSGALAFVRFRHTDSDIVRNARQQDFLRWTKQQYSVGTLISQRDQLFKIFGKNVTTDGYLHTTDGLISLFDVAINAGHTIKQIPFPAILQSCSAGGQTPCYVTGDPGPMQNAYQRFITPTQPSAGATSGSHGRRSGRTPLAGLTSGASDGKNQALALGQIGFPVYYPKLIAAPTGTWQPAYCSSVSGNCNDGSEPASEYNGSYPRAYEIHGTGGSGYPSYRMTVELNSALGLYYGIEGTTWLHAPILASPTQSKFVNHKQLDEYFTGGRLTLVAWRTPRAVYWVSNTLNNALTNSEMVGIAASLTKAP